MCQVDQAGRTLARHGETVSNNHGTEKLRQSFGRGHQFVFLDGAVPCEPAPGKLWTGTTSSLAVIQQAELFPNMVYVGMDDIAGGSFRFAGHGPTELQELYNDLIQFVRAQGPFDGLMGFSEGGSVAAGVAIEDAKQPFGHFKCAVFFSAALPAEPSLAREGTIRPLDYAKDGVLINIPTAHIWSESGSIHPGMGRELAKFCNEALRSEYEHDLGHDVPGCRSDKGLAESIMVIERTIERARCL